MNPDGSYTDGTGAIWFPDGKGGWLAPGDPGYDTAAGGGNKTTETKTYTATASDGTVFTSTVSQAEADAMVAYYESHKTGKTTTDGKETTAGGATGTDTTGGTTSTPTDQSWLEEYAPVSAYEKKLGLPAMGANPYQEWLLGQYNPTAATFYAQSMANPSQPATAFPDYLNQGVGATRQQASDVYKQLLGKTPADQNSAIQDMSDTELQNYVENVLRRNYASPVASDLANRLPALRRSFVGQYGAEPNASFLDYLKNKYNLTGLY
jgi:hypothetical protein